MQINSPCTTTNPQPTGVKVARLAGLIGIGAIAGFVNVAQAAESNMATTVPSAQITTTQRVVPVRSLSTKLEADQQRQLAQQSTTSSPNIVNTPTQPAPVVRVTEAQDDLFRQASDVSGLKGIPRPNVSVTAVDYIQTKLVPSSLYGSDQLDVSLLDDFIASVSPHARHYPPNFVNNTQQYNTKLKLKDLEAKIRPMAERADASYEVLMRAAMLNGMARNLDLGSDYAMRASNFVAKAIERRPNSSEANFLYGMLLAEGGGFKEGRKYLDRAAAQGYVEAEQSLAQSDLMTDNRSGAMSRLSRLQAQNPDNELVQKQLAIVQSGGYYIWDLPSEAYPESYPVIAP